MKVTWYKEVLTFKVKLEWMCRKLWPCQSPVSVKTPCFSKTIRNTSRLQRQKQDSRTNSKHKPACPTDGPARHILYDGERLTAGGRLGLYQLHPPGLITNPAVSLVHKVSQIINDFWKVTTTKIERVRIILEKNVCCCWILAAMGTRNMTRSDVILQNKIPVDELRNWINNLFTRV